MAIETPDAVSADALGALVHLLGFEDAESRANLRITGEDVPRTSALRVGSANAIALIAAGAGISSIWGVRTGRYQDVTVDVPEAVPALRSVHYVRHRGVPFEVSSVETAFHEFFRTKDDRWIWVVAGHHRAHHLDAALELLDSPHTPGAIRQRIAKWNAIDLENAMAERGIPAAFARSADEWSRHPQGRWLADRPVVDVTKIGDSTPEPLGRAARPLSGIRVLDVSHVLCGPWIARSFAEQGAEVLRCTPAHHQDPFHAILDVNNGKRSAYLDLRKKAEVEDMERLVRGADVIVQSWRPGVLEAFGFGAERAAQMRPGVIYVSVSCYGDGGPWGSRGGFDHLGQAVSGVADDEAFNGRPRLCRAGPVNDYVGGNLGAAGAFAALLRRTREGGSYHVKVSLARTSMWIRTLGKLKQTSDEVAAPYGDLIAPRIAEVETTFGPVRYLAPVTRFGETQPRFDRPPEITGTAPLEWR